MNQTIEKKDKTFTVGFYWPGFPDNDQAAYEVTTLVVPGSDFNGSPIPSCEYFAKRLKELVGININPDLVIHRVPFNGSVAFNAARISSKIL